MKARRVKEWPSLLPEGDTHPYRTDAWRPNRVEWNAEDLDVVEGAIPDDLEGVYIRNTENPFLPPFERYHPFDGDGLLHAIAFRRGRADYKSRVVPTDGLLAELEAEAPLYAGIAESPALARRPGWGARRGMKDASSTDVTVHRGRVLSTFYQCGDAYAFDALSMEFLGKESWNGGFPKDTGISAHPKVCAESGELHYFRYGKDAPYLHYGVVDRRGNPIKNIPIALPGPRLPHDMALSAGHAILNDLPLGWDPELLSKGVHRPRFFKGIPSRFALVSRTTGALRWFDAEPTYVLHFVNAFEDGNEVVLDGYAQDNPLPKPDPAHGEHAWLMGQIDLATLKPHLRRWRFDLATGKTREEELSPTYTEFPSINPRAAGKRHRFVYSMTARPGWFLFNGLLRTDMETGSEDSFRYPEGVYASESPVAPREGAEDSAWIVTFTSDTHQDLSECHVFDGRRLSDGPVARIRLPERIASGTHACFATGAELRAAGAS